MGADRTELRNLAEADPTRTRRLIDLWQAWATRAQVKPYPPARARGDAE
jgi:arylsulfatase